MDLDSLHYPPGLCPRNSLLIDQVRSSKDLCILCRQSWEPESVRVHQRSRLYHLDCFKPDNPMRIYLKDVKLSQLNDTNVRTVERWLERYNAQFRTVSGKEVVQYTAHTPALSVRRRELLETFKFMSVKECATALSRVSTAWRAHSLDPEVWAALLAKTYPLVHSPDPRTAFILEYHLSCYGCADRLPPGTDLITKHPVTGQPLCEKCFPRQVYNRVSLESYCEYLGVTGGYLKESGVRTFQVGSRQFVMPFEVRRRVTEYRRERVKEVGGTLGVQSKGELQRLDPGEVYHLKDVMTVMALAGSKEVRRAIREVFLQEKASAPPASLKRKPRSSPPPPCKLRKVSRN